MLRRFAWRRRTPRPLAQCGVTIRGLTCVDMRGPRSSRHQGREADTNNPQMHWTIEQLVAEEHEHWERESARFASEEDRRRLRKRKASLDQSWDLLRQRRALREAGLDPAAATVRDPSVVESYEQ